MFVCHLRKRWIKKQLIHKLFTKCGINYFRYVFIFSFILVNHNYMYNKLSVACVNVGSKTTDTRIAYEMRNILIFIIIASGLQGLLCPVNHKM